jgi:hypothetical protein
MDISIQLTAYPGLEDRITIIRAGDEADRRGDSLPAGFLPRLLHPTLISHRPWHAYRPRHDEDSGLAKLPMDLAVDHGEQMAVSPIWPTAW